MHALINIEKTSLYNFYENPCINQEVQGWKGYYMQHLCICESLVYISKVARKF